MPLKEGARNDILPFAPEGLESEDFSGDLVTQDIYTDSELRKRGHQAGMARRGIQNKANRQALHVGTGLAQFIANRHAPGVVDDGDVDKVEAGLEGAVQSIVDNSGMVPQTRTIKTTAPLTGGGSLDADLTLGIAPGQEGTCLTVENGALVWKAINTIPYELCEFYFFRHPTLRSGFQPAQGGLLANAATLYPEVWAYLQTVEGQKLCKTEAEFQAMTTAIWATLADGTKVGWNGIGGAPVFAPNFATGALRLPDLRGMYAEAAGFDSLGVGGTHGGCGEEYYGVGRLHYRKRW